jgi:hypothetical protein
MGKEILNRAVKAAANYRLRNIMTTFCNSPSDSLQSKIRSWHHQKEEVHTVPAFF